MPQIRNLITQLINLLNRFIEDIKNPTEIIGILAALLVLISMLVKTTNFKGTIFMRIFNTIGSIVFVYYGVENELPAVILMNSLIVIINVIYIIKEIKDHKKNAKNI